MRTIKFTTESWPLMEPFHITGYTMTEIRTLYVEVIDGDYVGRGEAAGVYYRRETVQTLLEQAKSTEAALLQGAGRHDLLQLLPSGGARNAIDAALWDLEAKQKGTTIWDVAGIKAGRVDTVTTVGIDTPENMAAKASAISSAKLKLKVNGEQPLACLAAVRAARPDADIVIDANQGWTIEQLIALAPKIQELEISMVEQPLPRGDDAMLEGYQCPIPLCADESCLDQSELEQSARRYDIVNIKLDKVGGLTAGIDLAHRARSLGLGLMVGNMGGTSLAMAPGLVLAQCCDRVDLDGPLLLSSDREHSLNYRSGVVSGLTPALWG